VVAALLGGRANGQHLRYSTHDWQQQQLTSSPAAWSDVKTTGDRWKYAVGTTWANHTDHTNPNWTVQFSGDSLNTQGPIAVNDGAQVLAAILQVTDAQGGIVWQRYFHGDGGAIAPATVLSTHARGISVFPGSTELETRIAICGETFDQRLPVNAAESGLNSNGPAGLSAGITAGFLAVYNGAGQPCGRTSSMATTPTPVRRSPTSASTSTTAELRRSTSSPTAGCRTMGCTTPIP
jgi:hypothetical protein